MQKLPSSHAAASTFQVYARKRNQLTLHITRLAQIKPSYRGKAVGRQALLEQGFKAEGFTKGATRRAL